MKGHVPYAGALAMVILVTACTPTVYSDEVERFNTSVQKAAKYFDETSQEYRRHAVADHDAELASRKAPLGLSEGCNELIERAGRMLGAGDTSRLDGKDCYIGVNQRGSIAGTPLLEAPADWTISRAIMGELAQYSAALAKVSSTDETKSTQSAIADLKASILGLVDSTGQFGRMGEELSDAQKAVIKARTAAIGASAGVIETAANAYVNARRTAVLRDSVGAADPVVTAAAKQVGRVLTLAQLSRVDDQVLALSKKTNVFASRIDADAYAKRLTELRDEHASFRAWLAASPAETFDAMAKAHTKLREALENPEAQRDQLFAALRDFADKIDAARTSWADLEKARNAAQKS